MSDNNDKRNILRYAELALKAQRADLTQPELQEMANIRQSLNMSAEEILDLAQRNVIDEY
jgi:uncharacterized protein YnzC (UPF0291/DUF896 family)